MQASRHWFLQRVTAGISLFGVIFTIYFIKKHLNQTQDVLKFSLASPITALSIICVFITFLFHARLGLQMIISDYLKGMKQRIIQFAVDCISLFSLLALIFSIVKIMVFQ